MKVTAKKVTKRPTVEDTQQYFVELKNAGAQHALTLHTKTWRERNSLADAGTHETGYNMPLLLNSCPHFQAGAHQFKLAEYNRAQDAFNRLTSNRGMVSPVSTELRTIVCEWREFFKPTPYDLQAGVRYRFFSQFGKYKIDRIREELSKLLMHEVTDNLIWSLIREYIQNEYTSVNNSQYTTL